MPQVDRLNLPVLSAVLTTHIVMFLTTRVETTQEVKEAQARVRGVLMRGALSPVGLRD
jgi:hypothetical protein